jgi:hypothetical protein
LWFSPGGTSENSPAGMVFENDMPSLSLRQQAGDSSPRWSIRGTGEHQPPPHRAREACDRDTAAAFVGQICRLFHRLEGLGDTVPPVPLALHRGLLFVGGLAA